MKAEQRSIDAGASGAADAEVRRQTSRLRSRGLDEDGVRFCMAERTIDRIIDNNRGVRRHIVIACSPKSASSFFSELLVRVTGFHRYFLVPVGEDHERQIDRRSAPMFLATDTVSQEHLKANRPDIELLKRMCVRPVVLVRDIFDSIVSLRDQIVSEPYGPWPMAFWPEQFMQWSKGDQLWFLVRMVTPWYLSFYASWREAEHSIDVLWLTYDDVVDRTHEAVVRVLRHCEIKLADPRIDDAVAALDPAEARFNKGIAGRGRDELNEGQCHAIHQLAALYQGEYDFSPIGIAADVGPGNGERE